MVGLRVKTRYVMDALSEIGCFGGDGTKLTNEELITPFENGVALKLDITTKFWKEAKANIWKELDWMMNDISILKFNDTKKSMYFLLVLAVF